MDADPARRAAWDAYLLVAASLLPALDGKAAPDRARDSELVELAIAVHRDGGLWAGHGGMLVAAVNSALRLRRGGHAAELAGLLNVVAHRLFLLSGADPAPFDA